VSIQRWPERRRVAFPARPGGVAAAVAKASLMADQTRIRTESVTVGATRRRVDDPLPGRGLTAARPTQLEPMTDC